MEAVRDNEYSTPAKSSKTKTRIQTPTKIIFTPEGLQKVLRGTLQPQRFVLSDGGEKYGIILKDYSFQFLQKMILEQYISTVEITIAQILSSRKDLLDLTKLISYTMLYSQFDIETWQKICNSEIVRQWNRTHPKYPIDYMTKGNPPLITRAIHGRKNEIGIIRNFLTQQTLADLRKSPKPLDEDLLEFITEKFLSHIRSFSWLLLTTQKYNPSSFPLLKEIVELLKDSVRRSYICEYIALLVLELVSFLNSNPYRKKKKQQISMADPSSVETQEEGISVLWQIRPRRNIPDDRMKLSILVCDQITASWEIGAKISSRANVEVTQKTLKEFYDSKDSSEGDFFSLGLYYVSFLKEACKELGISFNAFVTSGLRGSNYINLSFLF